MKRHFAARYSGFFYIKIYENSDYVDQIALHFYKYNKGLALIASP